MSKEYIELDKIIHTLAEEYDKHDPHFTSGENIRKGLAIAKNLILQIKSADVVEVVHGEWIQNDYQEDDNVYECSSCKVEFIIESGTPEEYYYNYNYCPNCGAKMDGGRKES